jgi:HlyD family secretion protein
MREREGEGAIDTNPVQRGRSDGALASTTAPPPVRARADIREPGRRNAAMRKTRGDHPRRTILWVIAALGVAAIVAALVWRALPNKVEAAEAVRRDVARTLVLTGRVRPPARPQLGASIAGTVRQVLVREGDRFERGQLLVRIDDAEQAAALAQARAAMAADEARARSTFDQAELQVQQASRDLARARTLEAQGAISARELEIVEQAAADAQSELDVARARGGTSGSAPLAEVARSRAEVSAAEARYALTRIVAPASGTVLVRAVEPGDAVVPGQMILDLALDGPTELSAQAREENLPDLRLGAPATASADAFPSQLFAARLDRVSPVVDRAQGTVELRFSVPDPPTYLRADMTISINVEVARRDAALVIPREMVRDIRSSAPWVAVDDGGRAVRRPVRVGLVGDVAVEISDGLAEGERVLPMSVEPGQRVRIESITRIPTATADTGAQ